MKRTTERRLLFALLVSSLVPVLALGFLTTAAVHRMGRKVQAQAEQAHADRQRNALLMRSLEAADRLSDFLRRGEADVRALSLIPRSPERYLAFQRDALAPVRAKNEYGEETQVWAPLYTEVSFADPDGGEFLTVRDGEVIPTHEIPYGPHSRVDEVRTRRVLSLPPKVVWTGPVVEAEIHPFSPFDGVLRFAMPVHGVDGALEGAATLILDPLHLTDRLLPGGLTGGEDRNASGESRCAIFFVGDEGDAVIHPSPELAFGPERASVVVGRMPEVMARTRDGASGVVMLTDESSTWSLAYTPLFLDVGPDHEHLPVGGIVLGAGTASLRPPMATRSLASITRITEMRIVLLTLAATFGVAFAAFLVARRMAQPWSRLREKARAMAAPGAQPAGEDELDEISQSFDSLASQVSTSAVRLQASEERLREFIEMNPDGIAVLDTEGNILHLNRALCQILRRSPSELSSRSLRELITPAEVWPELLSQLRNRGRLSNYQLDLIRGDGSTFPALLTVRLAGETGAERVDAVLRDISELVAVQKKDREKTEALFRVYGELSRTHQDLRRAYAEVEEQVQLKTGELRTAYEALQSSDRVKTEFLMKMSHELRTPLNCIIGYSEAMIDGLDGPVSADQAQSLDRIAQSGQRLLRMIENLLDLSRLDAGQMGFSFTETLIEEAIDDVLHQARSLVADRPIRLETSIDRPLPLVWADPDRVRQVLFNLVGNALKFTEQGRVGIEARRLDEGSVEVRVYDTGPGVPSEHLDSIFDKFVQVPGGKHSGAGLGLSICREIVEKMGGEIRADSVLGEGSTFVVTVPVALRDGLISVPVGAEDEG